MPPSNLVTASAKKKSAPGKPAGSKKKKVRELSIRPADNGGFIVTVDHEQPEGKDYVYQKPETYVAESAEKALEHVKGCLGMKAEKPMDTPKKDEPKGKGKPAVHAEPDGDEAGEYDDEDEDNE